ncbi:MAG TPA: FAD-linked oxidase C-terminal domain-containing protein [Candidatus Tectomicrobia bacterium]|nr:FAD-linked oxidase C-terminal domain-containing protein [Candidatus Tectomicrobia bacterium]
MSTLYEELRRVIEGEVRFDPYSRALYSTDASMYQIEPIGVVIPKHTGDVVATVDTARRNRVPVLPRGGGTSLAGQTVGHAVVMDFSKYMHRVLEVNTDEGWARVQPGVIQDEFNAYLRPLGFLFGPDTSTSNRATIGGMTGNNSAGSHSIVYGKTIDHVLELSVVLSDASTTVLKALDKAELEGKFAGGGLENHIYREMKRIVEANRDEIQKRYPTIQRRVSGYNLDAFVRNGTFDLAKMVVGSEGSLAVVTEAKVRIVPRPRATAVCVVHFDDLVASTEASEEILSCDPYAIEMVDRMVLTLTRGAGELGRLMTFIEGDPAALLVAEFRGDTPAEAQAKAERMIERLKARRMGYAYVRAYAPPEQARVWRVRKAGLGLLMRVEGERKPIAFVEDTAVDPLKLPEFLRRFKKIIDDHGTSAGYYGHASVGCLHIRPLVNLKEATEIELMTSITKEISDLVLEFGGAMSGEHGDGLARSHLNRKLFGPQLYRAFQDIKRAFDPFNIMNPGKIVNAPPMTENLRYGTEYRTIELKTHFSFEKEGGFASAVERCIGVGECRKKLDGTMCPSYMVTLEEEHSTRGRANALREALSGRLPKEELTSPRMHEVLDLCLECKGCKAECPINVDMAKLKYEFLAHYYEAHGTPLRARLFANIEPLNRVGCALAPLSTTVVNLGVSRWLMEKIVGIDRRRSLPPFARIPFDRWFRQHVPAMGASAKGQAILFHDTFMTYNYPEIGKAAVTVLERAGYEVRLVAKRCCGRPMISKGMLEVARANAIYNVNLLAPYAEQGIPIVGCEPSCILTLRDEYPDLVADKRAESVAAHSFMIEELLALLHGRGELKLPFKDVKRQLLLHGHCHQKALIGTGPSLTILRLPPGFEVEEVDSGCCGMAGSFGFEREHYDMSRAIGSRRLFPAVEAKLKATGGNFDVVAAGVSCRQQVEHFTGKRPKHPVEMLAEAL